LRIVAGARFLITGNTRVGEELGAALTKLGALPRSWDSDAEEAQEDLAEADGLILLDGLADSAGTLPTTLFPVIKAALADDARPYRKELRWLLVVGTEGRQESAGLAGLLRTVDSEYPQAGARYVSLDRSERPGEVASVLLDELLSDARTPAVSYRDGVRYACELASADLTRGTADNDSRGPAAQAINLSRDSVVVVVGGGRGIAAGIAVGFATASGCRIELLGRTDLPPEEQEAPDIAAAADLPALRAVLSARGTLAAAEINRRSHEILARREIRDTLRELRSVGSTVSYRSADVRDKDAVRQAIAAIGATHGRIDGLIFAAGVIEDKLIRDKSAESFSRVFDTKVTGAQAVLDALDDAGCEPRFTVLFGSLATYGSRGQADYAAANDALEAVGTRWSARSGRRCVTIHWGPWAPAGAHAGMVSPELAQHFARQGMGLIDPDEGLRCLLSELAWGDPAVTAVAYVAPGEDPPAHIAADCGGQR
jgi:NAD(P)-dependent dehydrogenase (short-subunit alcohol dehydrogenase family)